MQARKVSRAPPMKRFALGDRVNASVTDGNIHVLDDRVPDALYEQLLVLSENLRWRFGKTTSGNTQTRYWHHDIGTGQKTNADDIAHHVRSHRLPVFGEFLDWLLGVVPADTRTLRFYFNAHTYGTDGWPHTDTDRMNELTTVLYLTRNWDDGWAGETVVFDRDARDVEVAALPRRNRLVVFPSDRRHGPRPLSRAYNGLRVVLVVRLAPPPV
jgi:SM-20-related protein